MNAIETIMRTAPVIPVLVIEDVAHARPVAEALVGFLQGDDVGVDLGDDGSRAHGIEGAVGADALVHVVAGDAQAPLAAAEKQRAAPPAAKRGRKKEPDDNLSLFDPPGTKAAPKAAPKAGSKNGGAS